MKSLMHVVGPLVRLLGASDLTWEERGQISDAIFETRLQWVDMKKEQVGINQGQQGCGQSTIDPMPKVPEFDAMAGCQLPAYIGASQVCAGQSAQGHLLYPNAAVEAPTQKAHDPASWPTDPNFPRSQGYRK